MCVPKQLKRETRSALKILKGKNAMFEDKNEDREITREEQDQLRRAVLGIPPDRKLTPQEQRLMDSYFRAVALLIDEADEKRAAWQAKGSPEGENPTITSEAGKRALDAKLRAMTDAYYLIGKAAGQG